MTYKGVDYQYAFEFKVPVDYGPSPRTFRIVISDLRPEISGFSGLCLDNELKIFTDEKALYLAFFEIVSKIINITIHGDRAYTEKHGKLPIPLMEVKDTGFLKHFAEGKKTAKSRKQYVQLKKDFEKIGTTFQDIPDDKSAQLCDYPQMLFLSDLISKKEPKLSNFVYFRR